MSNLVGEIERFRALDEMGVVGWKRHGSGTFHPGHPESKLTRGIKRLGRHAKHAAESLWARIKRAGRSISPRPPSETHKPTVVKAPKQPSVKVTPKPGPMHIRVSPQRRIDVSKMFKTAAALKKPGLREAIETFRSLNEAKVGDYVTTVGGDKGYVQSVAKGKLAVKRISGKPSAQDDIFYVDSKSATVNPGGPPL